MSRKKSSKIIILRIKGEERENRGISTGIAHKKRVIGQRTKILLTDLLERNLVEKLISDCN
jgi:hypothetical protein